MRVRVQKWGNGLALRIPRAFATETVLDAGAEPELEEILGKLSTLLV